VAYSPDSKQLASGGGELRIWDIASLQAITQLNGHSKDVMSVAYSPDGKQLASGSYDKTVRLFYFIGCFLLKFQSK